MWHPPPAAVSVTFGRYAADLLGQGSGAVTPLAVGAILVLSVINVFGVKPGSVTQNLFTVGKILALLALIGGGLLVAAPDHQVVAITPETSPLASQRSVFAIVGVALIPALFSYGGWQQTNYVAEEVRDPRRIMPRGLVLGVLGVVLLYVLANLAYLRQLGMEGLAGSSAPAADVMRQVFGPTGGTVISAGIAVSTFGFLNLVILVTPRVYQSMAGAGLFFDQMAKLHPRYRTPILGIVLQATWSIVLTLSGSYAQLLEYVTFVDWIFFGLAGVRLIIFRRRDRGTKPPFSAPLYPWIPLLFITASWYTVYSSIVSNPVNAALGSGLIALGVPAFWYWQRRRSARSVGL